MACPSLKHQAEIKNALDNIESRIHELLSQSQYQWKHHKTVPNEHLIINNNNKNNHIKNITIHSLDDPKNKKFKIWKAVGYLPSLPTKTAIKCYTLPKYHLEYDDLNTMKKLQQFIIEMDNNEQNINNTNTEYDINVAVTNPKINGWISSRLCVNICCSKYSNKMDSYCCFGTFMKDSMLKQLQNTLNITAKEIKNIVSKNLVLYWGAKSVIIKTETNQNMKLTEITYILQVNNGGWIPQWAVEMGLIDQHMIVIFKQITKWLNNNNNIKLNELNALNELNNKILIKEEPLNKVSDEIKTEIIEINDANKESEISECETNINILSEDSCIESFNRFINRKCVGDWIEINDNNNNNNGNDDEPLLFEYDNDDQFKMNKHIIYNKIEDLEPESDYDHQDIEIVQMKDYKDNDELLSDGVYIDDTEIVEKEKQMTRCSCLVKQKDQCLVM